MVMDATLVVYANGEQQIHPWPWPQLERRTGEMQEELYDTLRRKARMDRMKLEDLQLCWQRHTDMSNQLHMLSVLGTIVLQILLTWPEFWLVEC